MKRRDPVTQLQPAPADLTHFTGPWTAEALTGWLEARAAWRELTAEPLGGLTALERSAMASVGVPRALVEAEARASRAVRSKPQSGKDSR